MRQGIILGITVLILSVPGLALAQMEKEAGIFERKMPMGHGMMKSGCPLMKTLSERTVIATSDGGVVVVFGNTMTKYDQDLDVVKEVELKMDLDAVKKMMEGMKGECPVQDKGMMVKAEAQHHTEAAAEPVAVEEFAPIAGLAAEPLAEAEPVVVGEPGLVIEAAAAIEQAAEPSVAAEPAVLAEPALVIEPPAVVEAAADAQPEAAAEPVAEGNATIPTDDSFNAVQK